MCRPFSVYKLSVIHFLLRPRLRHHSDVPCSRMRHTRKGSPFSGGSILMTSAPKYARIQPANGPAISWPSSRTRTPSRGRAGIVVEAAIGPSDLLQCHEDAVADTCIDGLAQVPFASCVFYQKHFAGTNDARLAIAGGDFYPIVQVDDVLPTRRRMPVKIIGRRHFSENNARGWKAFGEPSRRRRLDVLNFLSGKVGFAFLIRIEAVNFHRSPPV